MPWMFRTAALAAGQEPTHSGVANAAGRTPRPPRIVRPRRTTVKPSRCDSPHRVRRVGTGLAAAAHRRNAGLQPVEI